MLSKKEKDVLYAVIKSNNNGILPEEIAKELGLTVKEVEKILDKLEDTGFLYSEDEEETEDEGED